MVIVETTLLIGGATILFLSSGMSALAGYLVGKFHASSNDPTKEELAATTETMDHYFAPRLYHRSM